MRGGVGGGVGGIVDIGEIASLRRESRLFFSITDWEGDRFNPDKDEEHRGGDTPPPMFTVHVLVASVWSVLTSVMIG
jgi:hypothetical protein